MKKLLILLVSLMLVLPGWAQNQGGSTGGSASQTQSSGQSTQQGQQSQSGQQNQGSTLQEQLKKLQTPKIRAPHAVTGVRG